MRIFKIGLKVNDYKSLLPKDNSILRSGLLSLNGTSKTHEWPAQLEADFDNEGGLTPDFFSFGAGNVVFSLKAYECLREYFYGVEFLPVSFGGETGYLMNITTFSDCLDENSSEWFFDQGSGKSLFLKKFSFDESKVPSLPVFKIRQAKMGLFCFDNNGGKPGMIELVESYDLAGLKFDLVWSSNDQNRGSKNAGNK